MIIILYEWVTKTEWCNDYFNMNIDKSITTACRKN